MRSANHFKTGLKYEYPLTNMTGNEQPAEKPRYRKWSLHPASGSQSLSSKCCINFSEANNELPFYGVAKGNHIGASTESPIGSLSYYPSKPSDVPKTVPHDAVCDRFTIEKKEHLRRTLSVRHRAGKTRSAVLRVVLCLEKLSPTLFSFFRCSVTTQPKQPKQPPALLLSLRGMALVSTASSPKLKPYNATQLTVVEPKILLRLI